MSKQSNEIDHELEQVLQNLGTMILVVKSKGGYKFRERLKHSDLEVEQLAFKVESDFRKLFASLWLAERMLKEKPKTYHERWDEYQQRQTELFKLLREKGRL